MQRKAQCLPPSRRRSAVRRDRTLTDRRLRDGDTVAFDALYNSYNARLHRFLMRMSKRWEVAEDCSRRRGLRFVSPFARLDSETRLEQWLFAVARKRNL